MANLPRTVFAALLLAGVYAVALVVGVLTLAITALPLVGYLALHNSVAGSLLMSLAIAVTIPGVTAISQGVLALRQIGEPWESITLPEAGTEPLRKEIGRIAGETRTAAPLDLRLTPVANAGVRERTRWLGLRGGTRTLYIGLPFLVGLSVDQFKAVLGHEMGHYAGGHARASVLVHRGLVILAVTRAVFRALRESRPAPTPRLFRPLALVTWCCLVGYATVGYGAFTGYEFAYQRLCFAVRRSQEYEADGVAEHLVGTAELGATLRRTGAVGGAWHDFQARFLAPMHAAGCAPDDVFDAFGRMLAADEYQEALESFEEEQVKKKTMPSDTHPCLADRLARLRDSDPVPPPWAQGRAAGRRAATALIPVLPDRPWSEMLSDKAKPHGVLESLPWDECVGRVAEARSLALASELLAAVRAVGADRPGGGAGEPGRLTLADVLATISDRRGDVAGALPARSGAGGPGESRDSLARLSGGLFALIGYLLVSSGRAKWAVSWRDGLASGGHTLATWDVTDTATGQLGARVTSFVADPGNAAHESAVTGHLRSLGLDPGRPVDVAAVRSSATKSAGRPAGTVVIVPAGNPHDVRRTRRTVTIAAAVVAGIAIVVGGVASAVRSSDSPSSAFPGDSLYTPSPDLYTPPPDVAFAPPSPRLVLPTSVATFPAGYFKLPVIVLPLPGATSECPAPLGANATCTAIVVRPGDTLSLLACRYGTTVAVLQEMNDLGRSTVLDAGKTIIVPERAGGPATCG
jgi:Zn-dependent protease with chaperone function/LysM repeat protein